MIDLFEIDKNLKYEYILTLCKPNQEPIQELENIYGLKYEAKFPTTDQITFQIPYYIINKGIKEKNKLWDLVKGDYLIHCQRKYHKTIIDQKYFLIIKPKESDTDREIKEIIAYSLEHELNKKIIMSYNLVSRKLYSITNEIDENGFQIGILNYISTLTSWGVGDIDAELLTKYRGFNVTEKTILGFLIDDVQKSFGCVFIFDTVNKKIHAKKIENIGQDKGFYISKDNYIKTINKEINYDEIVTRLYVYGRDNLSINEINPTGTSFIEDFSFYKNIEYMSQDLINALNAYNNLLDTKTDEFNSLLSNLNTLDSQVINKRNELFQLETELSIIQDNIDVAIKNGDSLIELNNQKEGKEAEISSKMSEIETIESQMDNIYSDIMSLRELIKKENNFTINQLVELDFYVREKIWRDNNYITVEDLWNEALNVFSKINQPPLTFEIDSVDFTQVVECQRDWKKFILGDIVNIEHSKFNFYVQVRLVGYTHDVDGYNLKLLFSNRDSIDDPNQYLSDLIKNAITAGTAVDYSRFKWDKSEENYSLINNIINSALDASKNAVLAGKNQDVVINERGISLSDITNPNEQMRIINNVLAMTDDNWNTAKLAITPGKIYAEHLYGKIGAFAYITANQITVGDQGEKISDELIGNAEYWNSIEQEVLNYVDTQVSELDESLSTLESYINEFSSDSKITLSEANVLKVSLNSLIAESTDIINIATSLNIVEESYSYENALYYLSLLLEDWIDQEEYPLDISELNRNLIVSHFEDVYETKSILINKIVEVRNQNTKSYVDTQVSELDTIISNLNTIITTAFSDNVITNIEAQSLKVTRDSVLKEATDVKSIATLLNLSTTDLDTAIATLNTELNKYIDKTTYPISVSAENRQTILTVFANLVSTIVALRDAIEQKRVRDTVDYIDNIDSNIREDLRLSSSLPTSINLSSDGIRASTITPNKYAQLDYRGLYISNGAIQIDGANGKTNYITGEYIDLGNAGLNNAGTVGESIRIWAGSTYENKENAPFKINQAGQLVATNATITGAITALSGTFNGVVNASDFKINGTSILSSGKIHGDYLTNVVADSVSASWVYAGNISAEQITAGTISANRVSGGTLSGVTIDVDMDASVGNNLSVGESIVLRASSASGGIRWGTQSFAPAIYRDPVGGLITIYNNAPVEVSTPSGNFRLDQAPVAVFA